MAGIYERLLRAESDRLPANLLHAAFVLKATGDFNKTQTLGVLNARLNVNLSGAEVTDFNNMITVQTDKTTTSDKIIYADKLRAAAICIQEGEMDDSAFRSVAEIA